MSYAIMGPVSVAGLLLVFCANTTGFAADPVQIRRTDSGLPIAAELAERVLASSSLAVTLQPGETFGAYGVEVLATDPVRVFASASSELLTMAVIEGRVQIRSLGELVPGEAALMVFATSELRRAAIDAARLDASLPATVRADLGPGLRQVAERQAKRRWWGYYKSLGVNAQMPVPPELEVLRRQYLLDPAAVHLRRDAEGSIDRQRELAAARFVTALSAEDTATVAGLLDPTPFVQSGSGWVATRADYAQRLVRSRLSGDLDAATVAAVPDVPGQFRVSTVGHSWILNTAERDNMTFVTGLASTDTPTPVAMLEGDVR
ncbi:MAG: hypothetical protein WAU48_13070 [Gammaproteobacteria bacterium]|jgi:hypothetical protein